MFNWKPRKNIQRLLKRELFTESENLINKSVRKRWENRHISESVPGAGLRPPNLKISEIFSTDENSNLKTRVQKNELSTDTYWVMLCPGRTFNFRYSPENERAFNGKIYLSYNARESGRRKSKWRWTFARDIAFTTSRTVWWFLTWTNSH